MTLEIPPAQEAFIISRVEGVVMGVVASLKSKFGSSKETNATNSLPSQSLLERKKKNPTCIWQNKSTKIPQHALVQHLAIPTHPTDSLFLYILS